MTLEEARNEIDLADRSLFDAFLRRMELSARIAEIKQVRGLPTSDPERELRKTQAAGAYAGEAFAPYAEELYGKLAELSRRYQNDRRFAREHPAGAGLRCGLLGKKLAHSYSQNIHSKLARYDYALIEKEESELASFLRSDGWDGLNVTVPYKETVLPFCTRLSGTAKAVGAVNTLVRNGNEIIGYNTDLDGFTNALRHTGYDVTGKKCLVLGSGGASKAVVPALRALGASEVITVSRTGENNYENLHLHRDAKCIVNATPVGMFPRNGEAPLSLRAFPQLEFLFDLIYNPAKTALLLEAEALGIPCENGLYMLVSQAAESAALFLRVPSVSLPREEIYRELRREKENLFLIGMPGCGKTTVGKLLAERLGRVFADCDALFTDWTGMQIPEYLSVYGEPGFRLQETQILDELGRSCGLVAATGGGAVTVPENLPLLRQNGHVILLLRALSALPTDGRPLSEARGVDALWRERESAYRTFADVTVDNNGTPEETVEKILEAIQL